MKTVAVIGLLLVGVSSQAFAMGHPHNVFAAHKQMQAKSSINLSKPKVSSVAYCDNALQLTKNGLAKLIDGAFSIIRSTKLTY